jgi:predicted RNA-binding protein with PIN domain
MPLIVDGYNVIFTGGRRAVRYESGECERLRTELLERLERYGELTGEDITVVFDGGPGGAHLARHQWFGGLEVIFSDPDSDADEEIKRLVRESTGARDLRIVTDDRELSQYVRRFRARVSAPGELLGKMERAEKRGDERSDEADPACKFTGPAPHEVDDWVEIFGEFDEEDMDEE